MSIFPSAVWVAEIKFYRLTHLGSPLPGFFFKLGLNFLFSFNLVFQHQCLRSGDPDDTPGQTLPGNYKHQPHGTDTYPCLIFTTAPTLQVREMETPVLSHPRPHEEKWCQLQQQLQDRAAGGACCKPYTRPLLALNVV